MSTFQAIFFLQFAKCHKTSVCLYGTFIWDRMTVFSLSYYTLLAFYCFVTLDFFLKLFAKDFLNLWNLKL